MINEDLERPATARLTVDQDTEFHITDVLANKNRGRLNATRKLLVTAQCAGAVVLKLVPASRRLDNRRD